MSLNRPTVVAPASLEQERKEQLSFWRTELADVPAILELPTDRPRSQNQPFHGAAVERALPPAIACDLRAFGEREGADLFTVLVASLLTLLHRYSGQDDVLVGAPLPARDQPEAQRLAGPSSDLVALRARFTGDLPFRQLLGQVRRTVEAARANGLVSFEEVVAAVAPARDPNRPPLFQVIFSLGSLAERAVESLAAEATSLTPRDAELRSVAYDQVISARVTEAGLLFRSEHNRELFDESTAAGFLEHWDVLLRAAVADADQRVSLLPILSEEERHRLLVTWNDTGTDYPREACIHELFEARVEQTPQAIAAVCDGEELTYRELNLRANRTAYRLKALGVGPDVPVGVCGERSLALLVGLLGVLKAGGVYVPLDPEHPVDRLRLMLEDSGARVLLTTPARASMIPFQGETVDLGSAAGAGVPGENAASGAVAANLAHITFTSGSTGRPKGVAVPHRGVVRLVVGTDYARLGPADRILQSTNLAFDVSVFEIWGALLNGARLVVVSKEALLSLGTFEQRIRQEGITVMSLSTALFHQMASTIPEAFRGLEYLIIGGEALDPTVCRKVLDKGPPKRLVNGYGPTENATYSTTYVVGSAPDDALRILIGRPIANSTAYILDEHLQPVPVGVSGELYVGGDGLARGYLNRPELTAERFLKHPFVEGALLYRTGDRARYRRDGMIDYLGRADRQVKIRGVRVEPGEIEAALRKHPALRNVAVVVREDAPGDKRLVAYLVPWEAPAPVATALQDFLKPQLPESMIPAAFVALAELPLTPNGKLNHGALPAPEDARAESGPGFVAPRTDLEEALASIWKQTLHRDRVGVDDSFFALGGHSLLATQAAARIRQQFQVEIPLRRLFQHPTVAEIATFIEDTLAERASALPITTLPRGGVVPMSFAQERLWFLHQLAPESRAYHDPTSFRLLGPLDSAVLERSLQEIVRRHESLRTTFSELEDRLVQVIAAELSFRLVVVDLQSLAPDERAERAWQRANAEANRLFDLRRGPLLRAILLRLAEEEHILLLVLHHIITDGWSAGLLYQELEALYAAFSRSEPSPLARLPVQYADYTLWQQRWSKEPTLENQLAWWTQRLAGAPTVVELPADRPRPMIQTFRGGTVPFRVNRACAEAIRRLGDREGATTTMILLASFFTLLHRYTGQEDILVGFPHANRHHAEMEGIIGFFVNTLVLRGDLSGEPTFRELIARVREASVEAYDHPDVPFERLVAALNPARDLRRNPLVQVMFAPQVSALGRLRLPGITVEHLDLELQKTSHDLTWFVWEEPEGITGMLEYSSDLFDRATVERIAEHLRIVLEEAVERPDRKIGELPLLSAEERRQLVAWNATRTLYPRESCVHELFEGMAEQTPEAVAAICEGEEITYRELNRRANAVAHRLIEEGVGPDRPVGILAERSLELLVGLLGILKAGGAYVPLDPEYPKARLELMLQDSGASLVLAGAGWTEQASFRGKTVALPTMSRSSGGADAENPARRDVKPSNLAYVMFTSGSTGRPKGVAVPHRAVVRLVVHTDYVEFTPADRVMHGSNLSFDASTFEIWGALLNGACLVVIKKETLLSHDVFADRVCRAGINVMFLSTALFHQVAVAAPETFRDLEYLVVGGDALDPNACREVLAKAPPKRLVNGYGPTENTTFSTAYRVRAVAPGATSIPIGRPIANSTLYILDPRLQPVPVGVPGELYVGGDGVARGYLHRSDLTAQRFITSPFLDDPAAILYRTGDRGRYLPDGNIEFLGRIDDQVKMRGFRIEPGEVEVSLRELPAVREAAVRMREDTPGEKRLVAYVVPRSEPGPSTSALRGALKQRLPDHLIPAAFVAMRALPLTPNGKVDHRVLPPPSDSRPDLAHELMAPRTDVEQVLASIWREVLGLEQVGIDEPFFEIGGHSLLLIQVRARIRERLSQDLDMVTLFQRSSIRSLAALLSEVAQDLNAEAPSSGVEPAIAVPRGMPATEPLRAVAGATVSGSIAIVGMAGRFPGASDVEALWTLLREGREGISRATSPQLEAAGLDPELIRAPDFVSAAGSLADVLCFDAAFFGFSQRDAQLMDPQHRLFLECAWEALESAGYDPARYAGAIGVFGGSGAPRYWIERVAALGLTPGTAADYRAMVGNGQDFLVTRVAYKLGLRGPAVSVQTACSTSLVAVHLACQSLLLGQCDMALAGGVSVLSLGSGGYLFEEGGLLSPDGRCRPFDGDARGTVPASGVATVVLKRLEDALASGDTLRAVIRGSAINNDGSSKVGYTAPSVEGQAAVIAMAHAAARVGPETIGYVEAHGTATPLGDPIEVAALTRAFQRGAAGRGRCVLGSVKSNLGHLDAAAGITGLIKATMALERELIPATLHFQRSNPELHLETSPFSVNAGPVPWARGDQPRRAGVSSFGLGGTNAHAVLEEAPLRPDSGPSRRCHLLVLSARRPAALGAASDRLADHLRRYPAQPLADVAFTLQQGRAAFEHRLSLVGATREEAIAALDLGDRSRLCAGVARSRPPKLVFLFPGVGSQQPRMGMRLYAHERVYREALDRCASLFNQKLSTELHALLFPPDGELSGAAERLMRPSLNMAAIFSTEYALAQVLLSWGLRPAAVTGHSLGEYTAACVAGVLGLEDVTSLVALRGQLIDRIPNAAMLHVPLSAAALHRRLGSGLSLAAINGPESCVASGTLAAVESLKMDLSLEGIESHRLPVAMAAHSFLVEPVMERLAERAASMALHAPRIPIVSNVTGSWMTGADARDPYYWSRHLRSTVRFADGLATLLGDPDHALVEVGPGRSLASLARHHQAASPERLIVTTMAHRSSSRSDLEALLYAVGQLWCGGVEVNWAAFSGGEERRRIPLPTYPFERTVHVLEAAAPRERPVMATFAPLSGLAADPALPSTTLVASGASRGSAAGVDEVEAALSEIWHDLLGVSGLRAHDDFFDLGGSSLVAIQMRRAVQERLQVTLSVHALLEHPTFGSLLEEVRRAGARAWAPDAEPAATASQVPGRAPPENGARGRLMVRIQEGSPDGIPLFWVQPIGGTVYTYMDLARRLGAHHPVYAFRASGLESGEPMYSEIPVVAARYLEELLALRPRGPHRLGGHSAGGTIAYEMACQLVELGHEPPLVWMADSGSTSQYERMNITGPEALIEALGAFKDIAPRAYQGLVAAFEGDPLLREIIVYNYQALSSYRPRSLRADVMYLRARERDSLLDQHPESWWMGFVDGLFTMHNAPGNHLTMMEAPHVATLARLVRIHLGCGATGD